MSDKQNPLTHDSQLKELYDQAPALMAEIIELLRKPGIPDRREAFMTLLQSHIFMYLKGDTLVTIQKEPGPAFSICYGVGVGYIPLQMSETVQQVQLTKEVVWDLRLKCEWDDLPFDFTLFKAVSKNDIVDKAKTCGLATNEE